MLSLHETVCTKQQLEHELLVNKWMTCVYKAMAADHQVGRISVQ